MRPADLGKRLVRQLGHRVHPALRGSIRRALAVRSDQQRDLVSIVIPVYNVQDYLDECLTSVLEQSYRNLEIIVVDDGSPDGSYEIARRYARWDPRISIVRQRNAGLGAARNTGIARAHGRYLCFADSDDTLPSDAIETMVRSLRETKSDFAVGAPVRFGGGRSWKSGWVKDVHAVNRPRMTLDEFPDILKDVFAWNKLFDAAFFRRVVGGFPEGIRYEDQEPTAKAYVAGTFDVLSKPVYNWRQREDGTSITQQKSDPADLRDRLVVKQRVSDVISGGASRRIHEHWLAKAIGFDLRSYFDQVPRTDGAFFEQLRAGVVGLASRMTPEIWKQVGIIDRIPALAVLDGRPDDVTVAVTRRDEYGFFVPGVSRADGMFLDRRYLEGIGLPVAEELLELGGSDIKVVCQATSVWWHQSVLRIEGFAYLTNLAYDPETTTTDLTLVSDDGARVPLALQPFRNRLIDIETKDSWNSHSEAGFAVEIDPSLLPIGAHGPWKIEVAVTSNGHRFVTMLRDCDVRGIAGTKPVAPALGQVRWMATFEEGSDFTLQSTTMSSVPVTKISGDGRTINITINTRLSDPGARRLRLTCRTLRRTIEIAGTPTPSGDEVRFAIALPELSPSDNPGIEHLWSLRLHGGPGEPRPLSYAGSVDDLNEVCPEHAQVRAVMTRAGTLRLVQNRWWAVAENVEVQPEHLVVTGRICAVGARDLEARLVGDTQIITADSTQLARGTDSFTVRFPFNADGRVPTTRHGFSVRLSVEVDGRRQERWLKVAESLQHRMPAEADAARYGVTLTRTKKAAALWVRFRPRYLPDERGPLAQRRLHDHFRRPAALGGGSLPTLRDAVLFESFNGRTVSDSALAIYNELRSRDTGLELFWSVSDLSTRVPDGATALLVHSRAWMDALHNSRYLVNNNNFPFYYRKHEGQTYVQTWHGTPLKRIGNDVPGANLSLPYRQLMVREAAYWDVLLAQNTFAAETLPKAFGYDGRVLELGYPRNDALVGPDASQRRRQVRIDLGITDDQTAVLYAPTWRDNVTIATGYAMVSHLDYQAVRTALGDQTRVLLRGHANTAHHTAHTPDWVLDVTRYPDVNDLMLAADVMITDYSSMMFDYCVTGKPMLFLTPDLDQYRDVTRGFYLDFEAVAPGPICRTNQELVNSLRDLGTVTEDYRDRYHRFAREFAAHDDGHAARRVVDAVWGPAVTKSSANPDPAATT